MSTPFNPGADAHLTALGYVRTRHEAEFGDAGNGESGPMPWFTPAWDCYDGPEDYVPVDCDGGVHPPEPQFMDFGADGEEAL